MSYDDTSYDLIKTEIMGITLTELHLIRLRKDPTRHGFRKYLYSSEYSFILDEYLSYNKDDTIDMNALVDYYQLIYVEKALGEIE